PARLAIIDYQGNPEWSDIYSYGPSSAPRTFYAASNGTYEGQEVVEFNWDGNPADSYHEFFDANGQLAKQTYVFFVQQNEWWIQSGDTLTETFGPTGTFLYTDIFRYNLDGSTTDTFYNSLGSLTEQVDTSLDGSSDKYYFNIDAQGTIQEQFLDTSGTLHAFE